MQPINTYPQHKRKLHTIDPNEYRPHRPGKCGTIVWVAGAVLLRKAFFCFVWNLFFLNNNFN